MHFDSDHFEAPLARCGFLNPTFIGKTMFWDQKLLKVIISKGIRRSQKSNFPKTSFFELVALGESFEILFGLIWCFYNHFCRFFTVLEGVE